MNSSALTRRKMVGLSGAGVASALLGASRQALAQDSTPVVTDVTRSGIAGGGALQAINGEVSFSLAVFRAAGTDGEPLVQGMFLLEDATDPMITVTIASLRFDTFEQLSEKSPNGRRIVGWATLNGAGEYPFLLQVEDLGTPGSGEDQFNLVLGADAEPFISEAQASNCDCGGYSYGLRSALLSGDLAVFALG